MSLGIVSFYQYEKCGDTGDHFTTPNLQEFINNAPQDDLITPIFLFQI